ALNTHVRLSTLYPVSTPSRSRCDAVTPITQLEIADSVVLSSTSSVAHAETASTAAHSILMSLSFADVGSGRYQDVRRDQSCVVAALAMHEVWQPLWRLRRHSDKRRGLDDPSSAPASRGTQA